MNKDYKFVKNLTDQLIFKNPDNFHQSEHSDNSYTPVFEAFKVRLQDTSETQQGLRVMFRITVKTNGDLNKKDDMKFQRKILDFYLQKA